MARISYVTHYWCTRCDEHFIKNKYPDQVWCPNKCGRRLRTKPKSTQLRRKNLDAYGVVRYWDANCVALQWGVNVDPTNILAREIFAEVAVSSVTLRFTTWCQHPKKKEGFKMSDCLTCKICGEKFMWHDDFQITNYNKHLMTHSSWRNSIKWQSIVRDIVLIQNQNMSQKNLFEMLETKVTNDAVSAVSISSM